MIFVSQNWNIRLHMFKYILKGKFVYTLKAEGYIYSPREVFQVLKFEKLGMLFISITIPISFLFS